MGASAIIMMCVACVGLWGGIGVSMIIMLRANKKKAEAAKAAKEQA